MSGAAILPKLTGADVELGNCVTGAAQPAGTSREAARALLEAVAQVADGRGELPRSPGAGAQQDWGRHYLAVNGGAAYIDLDHLELCLPETRSAHDHVAAWQAMLRLAQTALAEANTARPERPIRALVNNSDGHGHSRGGHLNVLVARRTWQDLMERRLHYLAFLAAHQVSSLVLTGQGKVGSENRTPEARYQTSQRADFIETLLGPQTTWHRPLVNTRDEPLAGDLQDGLADAGHPAVRMARLHAICYDTTLCPGATLLRVGSLQLVLALLEAGEVPLLALDDPLDALAWWSRDPTLTRRARLVDGRQVTAAELQQLILDQVVEVAARTPLEPAVPGAAALLDFWGDTLRRCRTGDWPALARRLDWVLKLAILERAMHHDPTLEWNSPGLKVLDHLYASLDPDEGLHWAWAAAGGVDAIVSEERIARLAASPPEDTRAWGRAMLLRRAGPGELASVDWDHIRFRIGRGRLHLPMPDPLGGTETEWRRIFSTHASTRGLLTALGARPPAPAGRRAVRIRWRRTPTGGNHERA